MGHVFIVPGDVRRLACDGWLLPTDKDLALSYNWTDDARLMEVVARTRSTRGAMGADERVVHVRDTGAADLWMVDVGLCETDMEWVHDGVRQVLHRAGEVLPAKSARCGRARPLLAVPVVGSGNALADPKKRATALA